MNILPKKRWHVRTKDNIARVRRDEAAAAEEEKERIRRLKLAEQEARTAYLRAKARPTSGTEYDGGSDNSKKLKSPENAEANIFTAEGNINFFKELEDGKVTTGTNKEHEEEKKAEQEKYEKSIGYLTYLGQDSLESKGGKAWYELHSVGRVSDSDVEAKNEEVGLKSKSRLDPINDIIKYTGLKPVKKLVGTIGASVVANPSCGTLVDPVSCSTIKEEKDVGCVVDKVKTDKKHKKRHKKKDRHKKKKHKHDEKEKSKRKDRKGTSKREKRGSESDNEENSYHKKCKKRKKNREDSSRKRRHDSNTDSSDYESYKKRRRKDSSRSHSHGSNSSSWSSSDSSWEEEQREKQKKLEALRAERLKREAEERRRAERLLAGQKPEAVETPASATTGYEQKYSSQYNPHIARQNQEPKTLESGVKYWL
ncbi:leukocyte receptor cluster member 1-like [Macrobrachium nipponense]|uniref:leukocyte receptor cluster member 1-like n=1 Tax=Macrobrachium nipponense TaxID=159736 RepID=UPI0030C8D10F